VAYSSLFFRCRLTLALGLSAVVPTIAINAQNPIYQRPPPPTKDSVLDVRLRFMPGPDVNFRGLGSVPFADESQLQNPGNPLTGEGRVLTYNDGQLLQDFQRGPAGPDGQAGLTQPTTDNNTGFFAFINESQRFDDSTLLFHRYAATSDPDVVYAGASNSSMGWEINYTRYFGRKRALGWQVGFGFNGFDSRFSDSITGDLEVKEFMHKLAQGVTPELPAADSEGNQAPYSGTAVRAGTTSQPLLNFDPVDADPASSVITDGATIQSRVDMRSAVYTLRSGPTFNLNLGSKFGVTFGAGVNALFYSGEFSATETLEGVEGSGNILGPRQSTTANEWQVGGYLDAIANYRMTERMNLFSGIQYVGGSTYSQGNSGRNAEIDFSSQLYIQAGMGIRF
jgi:hypothetical protein